MNEKETRDMGHVAQDVGGGILMACIGFAVLWIAIAMTGPIEEGVAIWIKGLMS